MSEQAAETPGDGGRRILGLKPKTAAIVAAVTLLAALGYFLWQRSQNASAAAAAGTAGTAGTTGTDDAGDLSAIQTEIEALQQEDAGAGTAAGAAGGTGAAGPTGPASGTPVSTTTPVVPATPSEGSPPGAVTPPPARQAPPAPAPAPRRAPAPAPKAAPKAPAKPKAPATPSGVKAVKVTPTSVEIAWAKTAGATGYLCRVTYQDKLVKSQSTSTPAITVSGLVPDHTYGFHVAARNAGGTSPEGGIDVKTAR